MNEKIQKTMPVVLSVASSVGIILTTFIAARETLKNSEKLKQVYSDKSNKKAMIKETLKVYWPAIVSGTATIASTVAGTIISKKYEASISATAIMLDKTYRKYKDKVKKVIGDDKEKEITDSIANDDYEKQKDELPNNGDNGERLYYEEHIKFFTAKPEMLAKAFALATERVIKSDIYENGIHTNCWTSFRVLLEDACATIVNKDGQVDDFSYDYGWHYDYLNEAYYGDMFIHYTEEPVYDENGVIKYYRLIIDKEPVVDTPRDPRELSGGYDGYQIDEFINEDETLTNELYEEVSDGK